MGISTVICSTRLDDNNCSSTSIINISSVTRPTHPKCPNQSWSLSLTGCSTKSLCRGLWTMINENSITYVRNHKGPSLSCQRLILYTCCRAVSAWTRGSVDPGLGPRRAKVVSHSALLIGPSQLPQAPLRPDVRTVGRDTDAGIKPSQLGSSSGVATASFFKPFLPNFMKLSTPIARSCLATAARFRTSDFVRQHFAFLFPNTMANSSEFRYQPLENPTSTIRLITILPGHFRRRTPLQAGRL